MSFSYEKECSRRSFFKQIGHFLPAIAGLLTTTPPSHASATTAVPERDQTVQEASPPFAVLQQFSTVNDIPPDFFVKRGSIYAFVERVIDGDTIRVRHYPGYSIFNQPPEPIKGKLSDQTIKVRLYGVDTPEIAKNKDQVSQPFAEDAKEFTKKLLNHQKVVVTFLSKDQYGRAICQVQTIPVATLGGTRPPKDASVELVGAGTCSANCPRSICVVPFVLHRSDPLNPHQKGSLNYIAAKVLNTLVGKMFWNSVRVGHNVKTRESGHWAMPG